MAKKQGEPVVDWWPKIDKSSNVEEKSRNPAHKNWKIKATCPRRQISHGPAVEKDILAWFINFQSKKENKAEILNKYANWINNKYHFGLYTIKIYIVFYFFFSIPDIKCLFIFSYRLMLWLSLLQAMQDNSPTAFYSSYFFNYSGLGSSMLYNFLVTYSWKYLDIN